MPAMQFEQDLNFSPGLQRWNNTGNLLVTYLGLPLI
jgi:hypothetical protein